MKSADTTAAVDRPSPEIGLVRRAVSGDAEAFAKLYDAYIGQVYRFVFYRVGDNQTAEDLTAQVFFKAWDHVGRYQVRDLPFGAWLLRIARNTVIDYYRTYKETRPLDPSALARPDPGANVVSEVERRLEAEQLRAALQWLTEDQRQVLTLRFIEGLSTKEVAKVMGKRPGAIRALQMRGLQSLAQVLGIEHE